MTWMSNLVKATAKKIAHRLEVSNHTVDNHTRHLFKKLGVHTRAAVVAWATRDNLV
ncbi:MAG: response regulator transcription factor [Verrucomicrobiales bacterium]|jgi:DNA-binding CsgD family transcriptional regulator